MFRYTTAENEKVKQVFEKFPTISPATVTRTVRQSGGLVMLKHAAPGYGPIPAQLRPDNPVLMNSKKQYHFHGPGKCPVSDFPSSAWVSKDGNKKRLRELIVTGSAATEHINKSKSKEPYDPETGFGEHHGDNREGVHFHLELAKYVLFGKGISKRIDVHPWSLPRIPGADRVFFALEGVLKADAILSAGEAVFDVPSVTVWNPAELKRFAGEYLREKVVFIVPDADGVNNLQVERQAFYIRTLLRNAGIQAEIASPPYALYLADSDLKGVDDFLGRGYAIDDLSVLRKEVPADRIYAWGLEPRGLRSDRVRRAVRALEGLSLHASDVATPDAPVGTLDAPMGTLSKIMGGIRKRALVDTLTDLRDALLVEGSLETETKMWDGNPVFDWVERPSIQVRPQFQAIVQDPQPLGAFWMNYTAAHVLVERQWLERIEKKLDARLHEEADKSKTERHLRVVPPLEIQETAV